MKYRVEGNLDSTTIKSKVKLDVEDVIELPDGRTYMIHRIDKVGSDTWLEIASYRLPHVVKVTIV